MAHGKDVHEMKKEHFEKKIVAVMLAFILLIGAAACGNNSRQSESGQDTIGQGEEVRSGEDSTANSASDPVAEEAESGTETEMPESTTGDAETAGTEEGTESNILIAYFSRVGNKDFDENVDAVTAASVNMDGGEAAGNKYNASIS